MCLHDLRDAHRQAARETAPDRGRAERIGQLLKLLPTSHRTQELRPRGGALWQTDPANIALSVWPHRGPTDSPTPPGCSADAATTLEGGGRTGIRTQERVAPLAVFKTAAFVRSATLPEGNLAAETPSLALVGSERFQLLAAQHSPVLERDFCHYGPEIERFLRTHDPDQHPVERHSAGGPWYEVTARPGGQLLYRGADHAEAKRVRAWNAHSLLAGSLYG